MRKKIEKLVIAMYQKIPCGVGSSGKIRLKNKEMKKVLRTGSKWAIQNGYGLEDELDKTEQGGCFVDADPHSVSKKQ